MSHIQNEIKKANQVKKTITYTYKKPQPKTTSMNKNENAP